MSELVTDYLLRNDVMFEPPRVVIRFHKGVQLPVEANPENYIERLRCYRPLGGNSRRNSPI